MCGVCCRGPGESRLMHEVAGTVPGWAPLAVEVLDVSAVRINDAREPVLAEITVQRGFHLAPHVRAAVIELIGCRHEIPVSVTSAARVSRNRHSAQNNLQPTGL